MNSIVKYILIFSLLICFQQNAFMQIRLDLSEANFPDVSILPEQNREELINITQNLLNQYESAMGLIDPSTGIVNENSNQFFISLFAQNAELDKDFEEFYGGEEIDPREYANAIYNRFYDPLYKGFQVRIVMARLTDIVNDEKGFWVLRIHVLKVRNNYVTSDNQVYFEKEGTEFYQVIEVDIPKNSFEYINIRSIKRANALGNSLGPTLVANYIQYFGPLLSVMNPFVNKTNSILWEQNHGSSTFNSKGLLSYSLGSDILTNRINSASSKNKNVFLHAGVHYINYRLKNSIVDFENKTVIDAKAPNSDDFLIAYKRIVDDLQVDEILSTHNLVIPLGIGYRLLNKRNSSFFISGRILPSFTLLSTGQINGKATYDAYIPEANWRFYENLAADISQVGNVDTYGIFDLGENVQINKGGRFNSVFFNLGFQLSPVYYINLTEDDSSWSIMIGADFNYMVRSIAKHDNLNQELFQYAHSYTDSDFEFEYISLAQRYASQISIFSYVFKIGLQHRFTSRP